MFGSCVVHLEYKHAMALNNCNDRNAVFLHIFYSNLMCVQFCSELMEIINAHL